MKFLDEQFVNLSVLHVAMVLTVLDHKLMVVLGHFDCMTHNILVS
jgi:hypothetical protein